MAIRYSCYKIIVRVYSVQISLYNINTCVKEERHTQIALILINKINLLLISIRIKNRYALNFFLCTKLFGCCHFHNVKNVLMKIIKYDFEINVAISMRGLYAITISLKPPKVFFEFYEALIDKGGVGIISEIKIAFHKLKLLYFRNIIINVYREINILIHLIIF